MTRRNLLGTAWQKSRRDYFAVSIRRFDFRPGLDQLGALASPMAAAQARSNPRSLKLSPAAFADSFVLTLESGASGLFRIKDVSHRVSTRSAAMVPAAATTEGFGGQSFSKSLV
jgi:hypothetical protein